MKKRKYYPNNWDAIKACPPHYFPPMEYEDFASWKIHGYQLPSSHYAIVRIENKDVGTFEEYTYKTEHHTRMRLKKEAGTNTEKTIATDDGVYHKLPNRKDYNNP